MQFIRHEMQFIVQAIPQGQKIPAKMCAKNHTTIDAVGHAQICPPPNLVHQLGIWPGQIRPSQPPAHRSIARTIRLVKRGFSSGLRRGGWGPDYRTERAHRRSGPAKQNPRRLEKIPAGKSIIKALARRAVNVHAYLVRLFQPADLAVGRAGSDWFNFDLLFGASRRLATNSSAAVASSSSPPTWGRKPP